MANRKLARDKVTFLWSPLQAGIKAHNGQPRSRMNLHIKTAHENLISLVCITLMRHRSTKLNGVANKRTGRCSERT